MGHDAPFIISYLIYVPDDGVSIDVRFISFVTDNENVNSLSCFGLLYD